MSEVKVEIKLSEALDILDVSIGRTLGFFDSLDPNNLALMLQAFKQLGDAYDRLNNLTKLIGGVYDKYSYEIIPDTLETLGLDSVKTGGYNFIISTRVNASIPNNQRDAGHKWLTDVAKCPELIVPAVNSRQLSTFIKNYFETHAEYPPEDAIKVHQQNYIQVRRAT